MFIMSLIIILLAIFQIIVIVVGDDSLCNRLERVEEKVDILVDKGGYLWKG